MLGLDVAFRRDCSLVLGALLIGLAGGSLAVKADVRPAQACEVTADLARLTLPLTHVAERVAAGQPVKIVAIGSSSTAGTGASSSASSYPSRLEVELRTRFPRLLVSVLNRGVAGEEAPQMVARFDQAVVAEKPDLVIWQVGTNALLHDSAMAALTDTVRYGIDRLKEIGADVIVIDPQFVPRVIAKPDTERLVDSLSASTKLENVNLFRRFAVMRYWSEANHVPFEQFVAPDGLHMNDWGYQCMAKLLAAAISDAATRIPQTAHVPTMAR
ncbi:MAG TPA: SGNH/GDSL hydrolase family protein [Xanthobacteraceae bacterium]|nr:SGNH/GDSL hydrolase family protein [Xanthobacteraceae bacterium]